MAFFLVAARPLALEGFALEAFTAVIVLAIEPAVEAANARLLFYTRRNTPVKVA